MIDKYQIHHDVDVLLFIRHICKLVYTGLILLLLIPHIASAEIKDGKANDIVSGIISFTQWTGLKQPPQLCIFLQPGISPCRTMPPRRQPHSPLFISPAQATCRRTDATPSISAIRRHNSRWTLFSSLRAEPFLHSRRTMRIARGAPRFA